MSRLFCACALALAFPAFAASKFVAVPSAEPKAALSGLELRVVSYDGNTNGELMVEVRNPTSATAQFSPGGLYFIPAMNPDQAPQRLGAVGSVQLKDGAKWHRKDSASVGAGATVTVKLDVYCIDSHRPSPTSQTPFRMARDRMPVQLTAAIHQEAAPAITTAEGQPAPPAKADVQGVVWKKRDAKWIRLDGEGKQELIK